MVTATETAQKKIAEILKEKKDVPQAVRVYLDGGRVLRAGPDLGSG